MDLIPALQAAAHRNQQRLRGVLSGVGEAVANPAQAMQGVLGGLQSLGMPLAEQELRYTPLGATPVSEMTPEAQQRAYQQQIQSMAGNLMGVLGPIVWHGSPHRFAPTVRNHLGEFNSSRIGTGQGSQAYGHGLYAAENRAVAASPEYTGAKGYVYKADLPETMAAKMLDWDKPLIQQTEAVKKAVLSIDPAMPLNTRGGLVMSYLRGALDNPSNPPHVSQELLAKKLSDLGVTGVRYLDQGSRNTGQGTYNYVVFPGMEKNLNILSRE